MTFSQQLELQMGCGAMAELGKLADRRRTIVMPTICHDFGKRRIVRGKASRSNGWGSSQRSGWRNCPVGVLMIKRLPMIMIRVRCDGEVEGDARKTWRGAARQQNGQRGNAHDRGAVRNQAAAPFPDGPDKRHVCTPL